MDDKVRYYLYFKRFTDFTSDTYWHVSKLTQCILIILISFLKPLFHYIIIPSFYYSIILLICYLEVTPLAVPRVGTTDGTSASSTYHRRYPAATPSPAIAPSLPRHSPIFASPPYCPPSQPCLHATTLL